MGAMRSKGVALFVSLILLLMLTIIGVSAVRTSTLEMRMVRNSHDAMLAFQAAEAGLREAEASLVGLDSLADFGEQGEAGRWAVAPLGEADRWTLPGVWAEGSRQSVAATGTGGGSSRYMIEHLTTLDVTEPTESAEPGIAVFRITARASGVGGLAVTMLQSTYAVSLAGSAEASAQPQPKLGRWSWQELLASY